jgi:hypothetical protein
MYDNPTAFALQQLTQQLSELINSMQCVMANYENTSVLLNMFAIVCIVYV